MHEKMRKHAENDKKLTRKWPKISIEKSEYILYNKDRLRNTWDVR